MEEELIFGLMEGSTKVNGKRTTCMAMEFIPGRMGESMKVNTWKTKNTVMECTCGQMEGSMKATGWMENNMERGSIIWKMGVIELESGIKERGLNG